MEKISVSSRGVKHRAKKVFSCQRVGDLSKLSPPIFNPSPSISVTQKPSLNDEIFPSEMCISCFSAVHFVDRDGKCAKCSLEVKPQTSNDEINDLEDFQDFLQDHDSPIIAQIVTPLFGAISVTENPFAENHCIFCGKALPSRAPGTKGRPQVSHPECGQLSRSLDFFANSLDHISLTPGAIRRLRSRLFAISNALQIPRDSKGRFVRLAVSR